jgi:hypothetical protein
MCVRRIDQNAATPLGWLGPWYVGKAPQTAAKICSLGKRTLMAAAYLSDE